VKTGRQFDSINHHFCRANAQCSERLPSEGLSVYLSVCHSPESRHSENLTIIHDISET